MSSDPRRETINFFNLSEIKTILMLCFSENWVFSISTIVLKDIPNNPSVQKFVDFIEKNAKKCNPFIIQWIKWLKKNSSMSQLIQAILQRKRRKKRTNKRMEMQSLLHRVTAKIARNRKRSYNSRNPRSQYYPLAPWIPTLMYVLVTICW